MSGISTPEGDAAPEPERAVAGGLLPNFVVEVGGMVALTIAALVRAVSPPFDYGPELVGQLRFALKVSWFPLILTSFALSFGPAGIQASDFLGLFGALDRLGAAYELIVVREFAPFVTAIVVRSIVARGSAYERRRRSAS